MRIKLLLSMLIILMICNACEGFDPNAYVPGLYTPTFVPSQETPSPTAIFTATASPIPLMVTTVTVCTNIPDGKLNVRFAPGDKSDVRGYLAEGEIVQLDGEQKEMGGTIWVKLSSPIEGWVNQKYLCEANP